MSGGIWRQEDRSADLRTELLQREERIVVHRRVVADLLERPGKTERNLHDIVVLHRRRSELLEGLDIDARLVVRMRSDIPQSVGMGEEHGVVGEFQLHIVRLEIVRLAQHTDRQTAALARIRVEPFAVSGVEAEQIGVAGIVVDQPVVPEIPDADQAGHVTAHVELLAEKIVQLPQNPVRPQLVRRMNRDHLLQNRLDRRHGQRGMNAVSGNVAEYAQAALRIDRNPLEEGRR